MHIWNVSFFYESVMVQYVYFFRYQKCAGIHWFKYHYLHKNTPCSEDFSRFDNISYTEWSIRSRLFSSSGAVRFLQVCTGNKAEVKCYLVLILCNILMFCKGNWTINGEHGETKMLEGNCSKVQLINNWVLFHYRARGSFYSVCLQALFGKDRCR